MNYVVFSFLQPTTTKGLECSFQISYLGKELKNSQEKELLSYNSNDKSKPYEVQNYEMEDRHYQSSEHNDSEN